jgi:hypothetical protein
MFFCRLRVDLDINRGRNGHGQGLAIEGFCGGEALLSMGRPGAKG